jgi:hypothetical protein
MGEKAQKKRVLKMPKRPGSIPLAEVSKAIKKIAAARRKRRQEPVADGAK